MANKWRPCPICDGSGGSLTRFGIMGDCYACLGDGKLLLAPCPDASDGVNCNAPHFWFKRQLARALLCYGGPANVL